MDNTGVMDAPVVVRFVIPTGKTEITVTENLNTAFERSTEAGLSPVWIKEAEVAKLSPTKMDVFVMDPFSGPAFDRVTNGSKFKCTVVGPRCLLSCLQSNTPVPELTYPMYTAAMKGLVVTCSGLDKKEKEQLRHHIERMAGIYSNSFHDGITHLVTSTVKSQKYEVAVGKETPVMTKEWVEAVWKVSCKDTVAAVDPRFSTHRCPALLGVTISVSQLNKLDKELLRKRIETHGGGYGGVLEMEKTTVLVCASPSGDKYMHAKKWNIPCLTSDWVFDSIDKGYCLPYDGYRVERHKANASTPTKDTSREARLAEVSMCSTIMDPNETNVVTKVNDTVNSTVLGPSLSSVLRGKTTAQWMADLDLSRVKKAGTFLDGCKVYLSGFTDHDQEHLRRVLKFAGATRLTQLVESVTHVVHAVSTAVSSDTSHLISELDLSPHNVAIEWLVDSMKRFRPVPESDYPFPPPTITNTVQNFLPPPALQDQQADTQFTDADLLAQYGVVPKVKAKVDETADDTATMSQVQQFLTGLTLEIVGFNEETQSYLTDWVTEAGGELVYTDFSGELDYLVTPCTGGTSRHHFKQHVSSIWLEDCLDQDKLLDIAYYHKIININKELKPLDGVVCGLSGYTGREREFLNSLVELLGGLPQEIFTKRDNNDKGLRGSTHLICPEGVGQKYRAALKWKLPIINCEWLSACLKEKKWVCESPFLVGDSTAFTPGKLMPLEVVEASTVLENKTLKEQDDTVAEEVTKEEGMFVVCPDWVYMCRDEKSRVQEDAFPHSFNPRMTLDISSKQNMSQTFNRRSSSIRKGERGKRSPEFNADRSRLGVLKEGEAEKVKEDEIRRSAEINRDLARMEELMDSVSKTPADPVPRKVMKTTLTSVDLSDRLASVSSSQKEDNAEEEVDKESQVMWVDPQEAVERAKLMDHLNAETLDLTNNMQTMDSFGSMNITNNLTDVMQTQQEEDNENGNKDVEKRKKEQKQRVFMASGWSDDTVAKAVEKLGGKVGQYDSSVTHLLAVKVLRSVKVLGSVAGGKWVLHPDYVTSSYAAGRWLDEEQYEWGNAEMNYLENCSSTEINLAKAAMKWRRAISESDHVGAFSGIQAIIYMPAIKKGFFSCLIESGGGSVLEVKPPYTAPSQATHCFTEAKYLTTPGQVDLLGMASKGIPVIQPIFLYDLLTKEDPVKVEDYLLEDFKPIWENRKRSRIMSRIHNNLKKSK